VEDKYGQEGLDVMILLDSDMDDIPLEDCPDCEQASQEWIEEVQHKMELFESCVDDKYDSLINDIMADMTGTPMSTSMIMDKLIPQLQSGDNVGDELLNIKKQILFRGITDGWLIEEYFKDE
jgi:hypothetical protein